MSEFVEVDVQLGDRIEKMQSNALKTALRNAMKLTGLETEKEVSLQAPVLTGNLRRSIAYQPQGEGFVVRGAYYGNYVNAGTSKMKANPFVTRSAKKIPKMYERNVYEQMKKEGLV